MTRLTAGQRRVLDYLARYKRGLGAVVPNNYGLQRAAEVSTDTIRRLQRRGLIRLSNQHGWWIITLAGLEAIKEEAK